MWKAILEVDKARFKRLVASLRDKKPNAAGSLQGKGAQYCVSMHSFSNLRMVAGVTQNAYAPGSTLSLRARLREYDLPVEKRANVQARVEYPDHSTGMISLAETQPGLFETSMVANLPGIYRFNVIAKGATYKGAPFTREQLLNAAIFRGEDVPPPSINPDPGQNQQPCQLLECLLKDASLEKFFRQHGLDLESISKCVDACCRRPTKPPGKNAKVPTTPRWSDVLARGRVAPK
jgi:hypothetical protein